MRPRGLFLRTAFVPRALTGLALPSDPGAQAPWNQAPLRFQMIFRGHYTLRGFPSILSAAACQLLTGRPHLKTRTMKEPGFEAITGGRG